MEQLGISKASYYRCLGGYVGLLLLYSSRRTDTYALPPVVMCGLELALKTKLDCPTGRYAKFVILELSIEIGQPILRCCRKPNSCTRATVSAG